MSVSIQVCSNERYALSETFQFVCSLTQAFNLRKPAKNGHFKFCGIIIDCGWSIILDFVGYSLALPTNISPPECITKYKESFYIVMALTHHPQIAFQWTTNISWIRKHWPEPLDQFSTKLRTRCPWVYGIQVCSNERPHPFPMGDNSKITKNISDSI